MPKDAQKPKKQPPAFIMAAQEVTVDSLAAEALKGATSLRTLSASLNTKQRLSYRDIVPRYKTPEPTYTGLRADDHLIESVRHGNMDEVKSALKRGANITAYNNAAIRWAAQNGHLEVVKYLHQHGADITAMGNEAIQWAARNGHLEVVKYLHQHGADITADDNYAIQWAAGGGAVSR